MNTLCTTHRIVALYLEIECAKLEIYTLVDDGESILMSKLPRDDLSLTCGALIWEGKMLGCNAKLRD